MTELILDEPTRRLCAAIADGSLAPVRLAVVAPGEYGKTALLDHLGSLCDSTKIRLVDDAHLLGDDELAALGELASDESMGLVVAARPRPRPAGLTELLGRMRGQIVLRPFDLRQVEQVVGAERAAAVHARTGGVPGLVTRRDVAELGHSLDHSDPATLRLLTAIEAGADFELLTEDFDDVAGQIELARATGLLGQDGALLPIAVTALRAVVPVEQRDAVRRRLAELSLLRGGPLLPLARNWLDDGLSGTYCAGFFTSAAGEALAAEPALAARLYSAAVDAGTPAGEIGARWAEAAARSGDLETALRLADQTVANREAEERRGAAGVAAVALAHRGSLDRSAELHRWAKVGSFAAIGFFGTGRRAEALAQLGGSDEDAPPTLLSGAIDAMARGIAESVTGSPAVALSTLVSAAELLEPVGDSVLLPDTPAALAAIVALHSGELSIAEPVLTRALASGSGGAILVPRHRLLLAWIAMVRGDLTLAEERLAAAGASLEPRDWLMSVALEVGLARRRSDLTALRQIWGQACEAVIRQRVDLFTLLAFGEFEVAAARLGDEARIAPHLKQARDLVTALGDPPLWSAPLHWSGLHAAILAEHPAEAEQHVAALGDFPPALSAAAGSWLRVLRGDVDAVEVEAAARGLHAAGLWWDGARLAGQAAIRTSDRKAMVMLLDCARALRGDPEPESTEDTVAPKLSDREIEVAELVLDGLTYKQIGERLFISAKTVEHHMARMRQRLGASTRSDLLSHLRELLTR
ncbi:LuxR C-terminal-related transcriptional regulator [Amycolatopsis sp. cg5]|uniref:helix-turn-helix transcriptional regulator n=1 Tax=Amycolatopsis sp. cg5 TaxID=3238802 RepID=UPI003524595B